ncbi:MAG: hypothetical protein HOC24_02245 [Deltaproteobacteria bacterium]|mgnify:CR=1 FL=1|jgi:hypothetical protein|nr:hypothetical protein [Deltaproteobacteria bacterium]
MAINEQFYETIRDQVQDGDVVLYKGEAFISRVIRWAIKSDYSHSGVVVKWNQRLMVFEAIGAGGVVVSPLSMNVEKYNGAVEWFTSTKEISEEDRLKMVAFAQGELGKPFNKISLIILGIATFFKVRLGSSDKARKATDYFCSSFVATVYNFIKIDLKKHTPDAYVTPKDLSMSPELQFVAGLKKEEKPHVS